MIHHCLIYLLPNKKSFDLVELIRKDNPNQLNSQPSGSTVVLRRNDFQSSTKLDALIQSLRESWAFLVTCF